MVKFQIWSEGFMVNGGGGTAVFWGEAEGDTFLEACNTFFAGDEFYSVSDGRPFRWACKLFDNEADARKNFG
jgi:hypothetical protein